MLNNIFLFKGKKVHHLDKLNFYSYPNDIITFDDEGILNKIIYSHDHDDLLRKYRNKKNFSINNGTNDKNLIRYVIETPVPQVIDNLNIYTTCINGKIIIGLIFDKDDNPYDYKNIFEELLNELLNIEKSCSFEDEIEIENLLLTIFIDIRRYGDEYVEKYPKIEFHYSESFIKVFLFGIQDAGKSSLVRRIKTGEFSDNYFTPTKKFNIEYIQRDDKGLLAFWDMPGQRLFRKKWLIGLQDSNILIYMIDIANQIGFEESKKEFWKIINRYELLGVPLLILANKVDLINDPEGLDKEQYNRLKEEIFNFFDFDQIKNREWKFLFTSVKTNYNIDNIIYSIYNLI